MTTPAALPFLRLAIFYTAAISTCWYAARRGGGPERVTALLVMLGSIATTLVPQHSYWEVVQPLFLIDTTMLVSLIAVALCADRYWPLYVAAIQVITIALHGVRAYDSTILPNVYARLGGELVYPLLLALLIGTRRHVQRGRELDWVWQVQHERSHDRGDQRRTNAAGRSADHS